MQRIVVVLSLCFAAIGKGDPTTITVHTDQVVQPTTAFQTGVCIEDVNHEIYGGIYSQMVFGESFQEPPLSGIPGFYAFGGNWVAQDQAVEIDGGDGPKLISDHSGFADGTVRAELKFADKSGENAGLLVRVTRPGVGADSFSGYEISLDPARQMVRLARHRRNFDLLEEQPCEVPVDQWIALSVVLRGSVIEIIVDGKSVLRHDDGEKRLAGGSVGLRTWHSRTAFRNLSVQTTGDIEPLPLEPFKSPGKISGMWQAVVRGSAVAKFSVDAGKPFVGSQSQHLEFTSGQGEVGIENRGLNRWGMNFVQAKEYEGCVWARAEKATTLVAALESADGSKSYAEQSIAVPAGDWQRVDLRLTPSAGDRNGRLVLKLKQPGDISLGYVFLQPGDWGRFAGLPVRRDVVEELINQGVQVMRYGGSMVNSPAYKWKNMIGPRDRRPPYKGLWYPYSTNGWAVMDFLNLCEASGIVGIPDLNVNESPQDLADFIEYVNGPADSEWGKRRVSDGHPAPYHLHYLELGNEERVDRVYAGKFTALADAIWKKDATIILVVGDFSYTKKIADPDHFSGADSRITNMDGHRQILDFAREHDREVWFDVHVWSENLPTSSNLTALPSYLDALDKIANGAKHKALVFELNANSHGLKRALANAISINTIRRDNRMPIVTSANALQPDGQNDNGWDQGLLFLNPSQVWLQSPGYVTQMQSMNDHPMLVKCEVHPSEGSHLDVTALCSKEGTLLTLEVVNTGDAETAEIDLGSFKPGKSIAHVIELAGELATVNTAEKPEAIVPSKIEWGFELAAGKVKRTFAPRSFTVIRFE